MSIQYLAVVNIGYVAISGADEECVPDNISALQLGFQALAKQRAEDFARSEQLWAQADAQLAKESESELGAGAVGSVQVADDFQMARMGHDYGTYPGYGGYYWD